MNSILKEGWCECTNDTRAEGGLEGYTKEELYWFQYMSEDKNGKPYYRIYIGGENYYETTGSGLFKKYFKIIT